ncbi:CDP-diacylglycerol diphosphatase [Acidisphaera sp. L21]|uniref:CDP-diacylglycerol diphosphatase n=1 Tax=Acidisphaera sp. L21 TaxID=1641851 RepID=UPI001C2074B2|nr:CDP-diacylglycerol diphosphatase [Acidisphaera sp. L21]
MPKRWFHHRLRMAGLVGFAALALLATARLAVYAADPNALWKIVHDRCVPGAATGNPGPCVVVGPNDAVLKDIVGATQFLLIPTARITGIESPALLDPATPNYFADAWRAHGDVDSRVGHPMPRDTITLVINPPSARSQEQLHIHIDCIRPDIRDTLKTQTIGDTWTMLPTPLAGQRYSAIRLSGDELTANPFRLVAGTLPGARDAMDRYTLIVVGAEPGFILLAGRVGPDGQGHGEDVQDHACALGAQPIAG